ncbi:MAG: hypothetical protein K0B10_14735 [Vicingaceae bacterium]|nr:hypothetical protein [Vicingaceae bacterium]
MNLHIINRIVVIMLISLILSCKTSNKEKVKFEKQILNAINTSFSGFNSNNKTKFVFILKDESKCLSCYKLGFDMLNKYKDQTYIICEPTVYLYYEDEKNKKIKVLSSQETDLYKYAGSMYVSMVYFIKDGVVIDEEIIATDKFTELLDKMKEHI